MVVPDARTSIIRPALAKRHLLIVETESSRLNNLILCVATLKRRKGQEILVRAVKKLLSRFPGIRLALVGSTEYKDHLATVQSSIRDLGLTSHVELRGHVNETQLENEYRSATIFVLPSGNDGWHFEGYGLVLLEAAAAGLPIVAMRGTVAEEIIQHERTGLLVDQSQGEDGLATAISVLLASEHLRNSYGLAAREHVRSRTWSCVADEHLRVYFDNAPQLTAID